MVIFLPVFIEVTISKIFLWYQSKIKAASKITNNTKVGGYNSRFDGGRRGGGGGGGGYNDR